MSDANQALNSALIEKLPEEEGSHEGTIKYLDRILKTQELTEESRKSIENLRLVLTNQIESEKPPNLEELREYYGFYNTPEAMHIAKCVNYIERLHRVAKMTLDHEMPEGYEEDGCRDALRAVLAEVEVT